MKVNFNRIIIPSSKDKILSILMKFIQCKICMNILNDPYDCLCCNQTFCKSCIENYIKTNNKCPFSEFFDINNHKNNQNKKINNIDLLNKIKPSSSNFAKIIQSLKFQCQNYDKGCNTELNVEEILEHEKLCKFKGKKIKVELNKKHKSIANNNVNDIIKNNKRKNKDKDKEKFNLFQDFHTYDSNNDLIQDNLNEELKHQDSIVSFSGMKNLLENKNVTQFNISDNENTNINILNNSKIEKSIEEINQKLSYINNFIINYCDSNTLEKSKSIKGIDKYIEKEVSYFSQNQNKKNHNDFLKNKMYKRNSMDISNKFYDSYSNAINNFINDEPNNNIEINAINKYLNKKNNSYKTQINKIDTKEENRNKKENQLCESTNSKTNAVYYLLNEKEAKNKNRNHKNLKSLIINKKNSACINMTITENRKIDFVNGKKNKPKEILHKIIDNNNENNDSKVTPKLGSKTPKNIKEIKPLELNSNLDAKNNNNNSLLVKNEEYSLKTLNEDIIIGIKNLENKITGIERLLQSSTSFKNQFYSIKNEDLSGDFKANQSQNEDTITKGTTIKSFFKEIECSEKTEDQKKPKDIENKQNENNNQNGEIIDKKEIIEKPIKDETKENEKKYEDENSFKKIEELINKIENCIKILINEKFDEFKKYMEEQHTEDLKKCVLDTNFDVLSLCTERLGEFEKLLNDKLNNIKL